MVTSDELLVKAVQFELEKQLDLLPRKDIAMKALENSMAIVVKDLREGIALVNEYAAEHLILACKNDEAVAEDGTVKQVSIT